MDRKVRPFMAILAMAMIAQGANPYYKMPRQMTEIQKRRRDEYERERNHRLNPVDLSEREFTIKGERIIARNKKIAKKIYERRHKK